MSKLWCRMYKSQLSEEVRLSTGPLGLVWPSTGSVFFFFVPLSVPPVSLKSRTGTNVQIVVSYVQGQVLLRGKSIFLCICLSVDRSFSMFPPYSSGKLVP